MERIKSMAELYISKLNIPTIQISDIIEILIIAFLIYQILVWLKNSRGWVLLKGISFIMIFVLLAVIFEMNTILWIVRNVLSIAITAVIIVLQPELRKALEELGRKDFVSAVFNIDYFKNTVSSFSDETIKEISRACISMGKVRTGALIVIRNKDNLADYENTGIMVDGLVTSQLLINIFEKNTPLHDGAVIVEGDRVRAATCYLPLSDSTFISKDLGTRHRAGVGMSEATDSMVIIVSEETGAISVAYRGRLFRGLNKDGLEQQLEKIQNKQVEEKKRIFIRNKGEKTNEKTNIWYPRVGCIVSMREYRDSK